MRWKREHKSVPSMNREIDLLHCIFCSALQCRWLIDRLLHLGSWIVQIFGFDAIGIIRIVGAERQNPGAIIALLCAGSSTRSVRTVGTGTGSEPAQQSHSPDEFLTAPFP